MLTGKQFEQRQANTLDEARLDLAARGFWAAGQTGFLNKKVFYPNYTRYVQQCFALN